MSQRLMSASSILASGVPPPKNSAAPQSCKGTCRLFDIRQKSEVHTFSLITAYLFHPPFDYASLTTFYAATFRTSTGRFYCLFAPTAKNWSHSSERGTR
jgi:hypothetical protein